MMKGKGLAEKGKLGMLSIHKTCFLIAYLGL
jgi:hypothetical protein